MNQFEQIFQSAEIVSQNRDYTSATILYFKSIFVALDHIILHKIGRTPKDHTERFRLTEKEFKEYYERLDLKFSIYRDTYSKTISEEICEEIKNEAKYFIEEAKKRG